MSTEAKKYARVQIKQNLKTCIVELSNVLARQCIVSSSALLPSAIKIEDATQMISYVSWVPSKTDDEFRENPTLYIGKKYADCLNLKTNDLVFIQPVSNVTPCKQVFVAPVKEEEWKIIELNSSLLEQRLLGQIRIVSPGLSFPVFLRGSAVVQLKIESMKPVAKCGYLEEFTELHIAPKFTRSSMETKTSERKIETSERLMPSGMQLNSKKKQETPHSSNVWSYISSRLYDTIEGDSKLQLEETPKTESTSMQERRIEHLHEVLRIHPLNINDECPENGCLSYPIIGLPPFDVYVNQQTFKSIKNHCSCAYRRETEKIVLKMTRLKSPRQKDEEKKRKSKGDGNGVDMLEGQCMIGQLRSTRKEECYSPAVSQYNAAVSSEAMAFCHVSQGALMKIECMHEPPSKLHGVIISATKVKEANLSEESITEMFYSWMTNKLELRKDGILLNDGAVLRINEPEDPAVVVSLKFLQSKEEIVKGKAYFIIDGQILKDMVIATKLIDDDTNAVQLSNFRQICLAKPEQLGGITVNIEKARRYLDRIFRNQLDLHSHSRPFCHTGSLLICASSGTTSNGCGRSSLGQAVCSIYVKSPFFCHVELIDCVALRGKKPETILHRFTIAMEEARWRQPSIVVFDDIDKLIKQPDPIKDASQTILHHSRLAEGLKDILRNEIKANNHLATILIAKSKDTLHEIFSKPSGWHFVGCTIALEPPDLIAREDILNVLSKRAQCYMRDDAALREAAKQTEGYLPADLEIVVKRAKHASLRNEKEKKRAGPLLILQDFEEALAGYKPLGLHGIKLHKPGNLGWQHVGGLKEAKKILTETFVWPIKYPRLFSKCPFRMRSGVLLYGPSGSGKTLLAGVTAKECGMNFVSIKGPELLSKYVGSSEQNVRDLFARAQSASPCILFFDEFDALAPKRGHDNTGVTDRVVNQLLTQLDGVEKLDNVFILAATSRPDLIDPALLRPGRLDKCVYCPMPNTEDRREILLALSNNLEIESNIDFEFISKNTEGFTGADLKAVLYNAQLSVVHRQFPLIGGNSSMDLQEIKITEADNGLTITENDVLEALKDTSPSVTSSDRQNYERTFTLSSLSEVMVTYQTTYCYAGCVNNFNTWRWNKRFEDFVSSRKGIIPTQRAVQRVTLA